MSEPSITGVRISNSALPAKTERRIFDVGPNNYQCVAKRGVEVLDWLIDFRRNLQPGETISTVEAYMETDDDDNLVIQKIEFGDYGVLVWLQGGEDQKRSVISVRVVTSGGRLDEIRFAVRCYGQRGPLEPGPYSDIVVDWHGIWVDSDTNSLLGLHDVALQAAIDLQNEYRLAGTPKQILLRGEEFNREASVELPDGAFPIVIGQGWQICKMNIGDGVQGFINRREFGTGGRATGALFRGIEFDGGNERSGDWPYTHTRSNHRAFTIRCDHELDCVVEIDNCRFSNFNDLPYWVDSARGKFLHTKTDMVKTKDPGILRCRNGVISDSFAYESADNAWSISRSNRDFHIVNCGAYGCHQGLFFGGSNRVQTGSTAKLYGISYVAGATLLLTVTGSPPLYIEQENGNVMLETEDGEIKAVVKVVEILTGDTETGIYTAECVALGAVPPELQNIETEYWYDGPSAGCSGITVIGWQSRFTGLNSIFVNQGCDGVVISDFVIIAPGYDISSPSKQKGNSVPGFTNRLQVEDASLFTDGEWVAADPYSPDEKHFLSPITDIDLETNILTLQVALPRILVNADVYACQQTLSTGGMAIVGDYQTSYQQNWAQDVTIHHGEIIDPCNFGIRMGSATGSPRDSKIKDVTVRYRNPVACVIGTSGVLLSSRPEDMRMAGMEVSGCTLILPTDKTTRGVRCQLPDGSDASIVRLDNVITATVPYLVEELATGTNITNRQNAVNRSASSLSISRNIPDLNIGKFFATPNGSRVTFTANPEPGKEGTLIANFPETSCFTDEVGTIVISDFTTLDADGNDWSSEIRRARIFFRKATALPVGDVTLESSSVIRTPGSGADVVRAGYFGLTMEVSYDGAQERNILQIYG